jgi:hypothetical protein
MLGDLTIRFCVIQKLGSLYSTECQGQGFSRRWVVPGAGTPDLPVDTIGFFTSTRVKNATVAPVAQAPKCPFLLWVQRISRLFEVRKCRSGMLASLPNSLKCVLICAGGDHGLLINRWMIRDSNTVNAFRGLNEDLSQTMLVIRTFRQTWEWLQLSQWPLTADCILIVTSICALSWNCDWSIPVELYFCVVIWLKSVTFALLVFVYFYNICLNLVRCW